MELKRMIVHKVEKEQHANIATVSKRDTLLANNELAQKFVSEVNKAYKKTTSNKGYGVFNTGDQHYRFQIFLRDYLQNATDEEFINFSKLAVDELKAEMVKRPASTGGNLFLIHYTDDEEEVISVIILSDKLAYILNANLDLSGEINLDTDKINMAAMIKINLLDNNEDKPYLSFVQGKKQITNYFTDFIGCTTYQDSAASTALMVTAVEKYMVAQEYSRTRQKEVEDNLVEYFESNEEVDIETIANYVNPEAPDSFLEYIEPFEINTEFQPKRQQYKRFIKIEYKDKNLTLVFSKDLKDDGTVRYDDATSSIIIKDTNGGIKRKYENG